MDLVLFVAILFVTFGLMLLSLVAQFVAWRSAAKFQQALLECLSSLEFRAMAQLTDVRRLLKEQEHRRIMRDAREARIRLETGSDIAAAQIDVARVNDGQAKESRRNSRRLRRESILRLCDETNREFEED